MKDRDTNTDGMRLKRQDNWVWYGTLEEKKDMSGKTSEIQIVNSLANSNGRLAEMLILFPHCKKKSETQRS